MAVIQQDTAARQSQEEVLGWLRDEMARAATPQETHSPQFGPAILAVIPAYNEERFIGSLVLKLLRDFARVVVIDDGSVDETAQRAQQAGAIVVTHEVNSGKTAAVNTAFRVAHDLQARALVLLDGDGQHRPEDAIAVLGPVLAGIADMVVGSRYLGQHSETPVHRIIGQVALNALTNVSSGVPTTDSQSGLRAFSAQAIAVLAFSSHGFAVESEMQFAMQTQGLRVAEVPITVLYREPNKRNPFVHGMQVVNGIVRLVARQRPLLLFTGTGLLVIALGLSLGSYVALCYTDTHQLAIGYALLTVLLIVVGTVAAFFGLMMNSLTGLIGEVDHDLKMVGKEILPSPLALELGRRSRCGVQGGKLEELLRTEFSDPAVTTTPLGWRGGPAAAQVRGRSVINQVPPRLAVEE